MIPLLCLALFLPAQDEANWPQWRGPTGDGVAPPVLAGKVLVQIADHEGESFAFALDTGA